MSNKIVLQHMWYFEEDTFLDKIIYFVNAKYEIHVLLFGIIKYDYSDRFDPKVFQGPFFGPYGKWFSLVNPNNVIYDYDYVEGYKQLYRKLKLPIDRFAKNKENSYIEYSEKLKVFGYLDYDSMCKVYEKRND